jgi:hypothetical protein
LKTYILFRDLQRPFSNLNQTLTLEFNYKELSESGDCARFYIDLNQPYLLRTGVLACGSHRRFKLDFRYKNRTLEWQRYIRIPEQEIED